MSDVVLNVPVNAPDVDPLLDALNRINETLEEINSKNPMGNLNKSLKDSNKELVKTEKSFTSIFQKVKLSGLMGGAVKGLAGLSGVGSLSMGALLFGAFKNVGSNISTSVSADALGLTVQQMMASETASQMTWGSKDTGKNAMVSIQNALLDRGKASAFSQLGLNAETIRNMSPVDALTTILEQARGMGEGTQEQREAFNQLIGGGISWQSNKNATESYAKEFTEAFKVQLSKINFDDEALKQADKALIDFQATLGRITKSVGGELAPALTSVFEKLTPHIETFGNYLADLLSQITQEDVDNFIELIKNVAGFIGNTASAVGQTAEGLSQVGAYITGTKEEKEKIEKNMEAKSRENAEKYGLYDTVSKNLLFSLIKKPRALMDIEKSWNLFDDTKAYVKMLELTKDGQLTNKGEYFEKAFAEATADGRVTQAEFTDLKKILSDMSVNITINQTGVQTTNKVETQVKVQGVRGNKQ